MGCTPFWLAAILVASTAVPACPQDLLVRHARLFDGTDGPVREDTDVLVRGGRIVAIAPAIAADDAPVLEVAGASVLPGLIDAHAHFTWAPGASFRGDTTDTAHALNRAHLRGQLACGVTTVLDP